MTPEREAEIRAYAKLRIPGASRAADFINAVFAALDAERERNAKLERVAMLAWEILDPTRMPALRDALADLDAPSC